MHRCAEQLLGRRELDEPPAIHHGHAVADLAHEPQIVRDEEIRQAEALLQVEQEVDDLRLHGDVERRDGLVADDERRLERDRARDADALALAAAELVRIFRRVRGIEPDHLEELADPRDALVARADPVDRQRLAHDIADAHARVERRVRILKDDLQMPPRLAQLARPEREHVLILEPHFAGARLDQPQHAPARRRLARAGFADEPERLARGDGKADVVDRAHGRAAAQEAAASGKLLHEMTNIEKRRHARPLPAGCVAGSLRKQRTSCDDSTLVISGARAVHGSKRSAQRGENAQPAGA